jgi:hypothetical protein
MNLQELESRLQSMIEVDLLKLLPGRKVEDVIVQKIAAAIHLNATTLKDGSAAAPNVYTLVIHPEAADKWQDQQLVAILLHSITTVTQEAGFQITMTPTITITTDENLSLHDARVMASHRIEPMAETNASPLDTGKPEEQNKIPDNAFLIVEGVKVFPLKLPVINIGRRLDNQLVIDDPRVSRNHAQLRAIKGRFVVFDLNSTGGTFVNAQRASQTVLYPGDVISLAGVALIFGQDNPPPRPDLKETAPLLRATTDRPTAILVDHSTAKLKRK